MLLFFLKNKLLCFNSDCDGIFNYCPCRLLIRDGYIKYIILNQLVIVICTFHTFKIAVWDILGGGGACVSTPDLIAEQYKYDHYMSMLGYWYSDDYDHEHRYPYDKRGKSKWSTFNYRVSLRNAKL